MVEHIRKTSETLILILVVLSPWAFGCIHPYFRYILTAGICFLLAMWAVELIVAPRDKLVTRFQVPLLGLVGIALLQILPLGPVADLLSPNAAAWKQAMLPEQIEQLADGSTATVPALTARDRVSLYPAESLKRMYWLVLMALLFTRVQDLASPDTLRRLCYVCLINGSILAYFSVIQAFTSDTGKIYWTFQSMGAAFGPFINRNHFAFYTNICFGLSLGLIGSRQMGKYTRFSFENVIDSLKDSVSLWMASVLVFMLGAVILCSSRSGLISLIGSSLITAMFIAATGTFQQGWKWFLLAAGIFGVAAGVQMWLGFDFVDSRYANTLDNRTELWVPLLQLVSEFPLVGSGLGTLPHVEPSTRPIIGARDYYLEYAHNEYLQLAIEMGITGLLMACSLVFLLTSKIAKRIKKSRHNAWLYVGLLFSLSSISLHSFTEFGLAIPAIAFLAAIVMGHIAGVGRVKPERTGDASMSGQISSRVAAVAILVVAFITVQDARRIDLAERSLLQAQRAYNEGRTSDELQHFSTALAYTPTNIELLLDDVLLQFDGPQETNEQLEDGEQLENGDAGLDFADGQDTAALATSDATDFDSTDFDSADSSANNLEDQSQQTKERTAISDAPTIAADLDVETLSRVQQMLINARELCPVSGDPHFLLGRHNATFTLADDELTYFTRALQTRPTDPTLAYIAGLANLERGEQETTLRLWRQSMTLSRKHVIEIMQKVAETWTVELAETESAMALFDQLLPQQSAGVLASVADWYERNIAKPAATENAATEDTATDSPQPNTNPGSTPSTTSDANGDTTPDADRVANVDQPAAEDESVAAQLRRRALATDELTNANTGQLHYLRATLHIALKDDQEAIKSLKNAVRYEPKVIGWRLQLAALLGKQQDFDNAHRHVKRVLRSHPNNGAAKRLQRELLLEQSK